MKATAIVRRRILPAIAAVLVIAALATAAWHGYGAIASHPFERVVFSGNLEKLALEDLQALVVIVKGTSSIAAVRAAAKRVPWVREASVRRAHPHTVEIAFETHDVLARWGERALVSPRGEIFIAPHVGTLPRLRGPDAAAPLMAAGYPAIARAVAPLAASVTELRLSPRGSWHAVLDSGLELELGRGRAEILPRVERFVAAWPRLAAQGVETHHADLRHSGGFAIRSANVKR